MNSYQTQLYFDLLGLVEKSDAFFMKDFFYEKTLYRIFNYRLASYSDFLQDNALEARGVMFEINAKGTPVALASLPMHKFFNYKENPFTENVDFSETNGAMIKEDGSLTSTFIHGNTLRLKTKGSIESHQCLDAMIWLKHPDNRQYRYELETLALHDYTVNMEWTSPNNRIVLGYQKDNLVVLNIRDNTCGKYIPIETLTNYHEIQRHAVQDHIFGISNVEEFVESIPKKEGIEGYVIRLRDDTMVKIKTEWYLSRHRAKDSINSPKRLFCAIVGEEVDDVRVLFHDDPGAIKIIDDMTALIEPKFNGMIEKVERYYNDNKDLSRKDYAIKAQALQDGFMGLYMNLYTGRENDYKTFAQKNYEMFIGKVTEGDEDVSAI